MRAIREFIQFGFIILITNNVFGQTPGNIFAGSSSILDPNSDDYITANGSTLLSNDELSQFEGEWRGVYQYSSEPSGDFSGNGCGSVDIIDATSSSNEALYHGIYDPDGYPTNHDGDEYWLFRMRVAKSPGSSKFSYNVVIDQDNKWGQGVDPNYTSGNGGFEIEIMLVSGNKSKITVVDVDGTTNGTVTRTYSNPHYLRSYAANSICTKNDPVFLDWAIPFADLDNDFGLTSQSTVRYAAGTGASSGSSILSKSGTKDYAGIDDQQFTEPVEQIITTQSSTALPVELRRFSLSDNPKEIQLEWKTDSELNNDYFKVQFSEFGHDYKNISKKINGYGTTLIPREYSHSVAKSRLPAQGYFRLKQVDYDGTTDYSDILVYKTNLSAKKEYEINALGQRIQNTRNYNSLKIHIENGKVTKSIVAEPQSR